MSQHAAGGAAPRVPLTAARVLAIAVPVVLSNATVPIQGAVDTAVIGRIGSEVYLAAVGLGAQCFGLLFGSLNFLQIGASGLSAQALGAGDQRGAIDVLARAVVIAFSIAAVLILAQAPLLWAGLAIFEGSDEAERLAAVYFRIRIWGAPAELANYALIGWFAGQEMPRRLFKHQVVLAGTNVSLNILFVLGFGYDVDGVATATVIASFVGFAYGLWLARGRVAEIAPEGWRFDAARVLAAPKLLRVMALNRDIFIRTLLLVGAFAWMTRQGSIQGDLALAANVVLWQFFTVSAYGLDGFAISAESLVGQAQGARDRMAFRRAAMLTSVMAFALAGAVSLALVLLSGPIIDVFTTVPEVRESARVYALWAALTPLVGVAAFQLDGIFVGATRAREMRNTMILSALAYFPGSIWLAATFGNHGVWAALHLFLIVRAVTMLAIYPRLEREAAL